MKEPEVEKLSMQQLKLKVVHNGYVIEGIFSKLSRYPEQIVFEEFDKMIDWLRINLKEINK